VIGNRTKSEVFRYDLAKLIVALILLVILILLLLQSCGGPVSLATATEQPTAAQAATEQATLTTEVSSKATTAETLEPTERATIQPAAIVPAITSPHDGDQIATDLLTLQGTGAPGTELVIMDSGVAPGRVTVDASGSWSFQYQVAPGLHQIVVSTVDGGLRSDPVGVTILTPGAQPPVTAAPTEAATEVAAGGQGCSPNGVPPSGFLQDKDHYVVGSCDTLSGIAVWLNVTVDSLLASNPQVTDPDKIVPGEVLNVPHPPD
jgi:LysM domain